MVLKLFTTFRIKTGAGELDCQQDNPLSKRVGTFELRQVLALFLYIFVGNRLILFLESDLL